MGEVTLKVPAEHAEDFRRALVKEMEIDIGSVNANRESLEKAMYMENFGGHPADSSREDVRGSMATLLRDAALMEEADLTGSGAIEIRTSDVDSLAAACETMAREIVGKQLADALGCAPLDERYTAKALRPLIDRLSWALDHAAELYSVNYPEEEAA